MSTRKSSQDSTAPSVVVRRPGQEDTIIDVADYDCFSIRPPSIAIIRQSSGRSTRSHPASEHQDLQCYIDPNNLPYIDVDEGSLFVKDTLTADELKLNPIGWSLNEPYRLQLQPSQTLNVPQKAGSLLSFQCPADGESCMVLRPPYLAGVHTDRKSKRSQVFQIPIDATNGKVVYNGPHTKAGSTSIENGEVELVGNTTHQFKHERLGEIDFN